MFLIMFLVYHRIYILLYFLRNVLDQLRQMIDLEDIFSSLMFDNVVLLEEIDDLTRDYHHRSCSDQSLMMIDSYFHLKFQFVLHWQIDSAKKKRIYRLKHPLYRLSSITKFFPNFFFFLFG
jgi:hypothetical protein